MAGEIAAWAASELGEEPEVEVPAVEQQESGSCGLAALRAVLMHYGEDVAEDELKPLTGWSAERGTSREGLAAAARALGFDAQPMADATLEDLAQMVGMRGVPAIVSWFSEDEGHFSVVKAIDESSVTMLDVEGGEDRTMPIDEFERVWFDFEGETKDHAGLVNHGMVVVTPRGGG